MYKTKTDPQTQRTNLQLQKGKEGTEEFQTNIYTTYKKNITNKDRRCCTENYTIL